MTIEDFNVNAFLCEVGSPRIFSSWVVHNKTHFNKKMVNEEKLKRYIKEELSKTEVRNIIDSKIADLLKTKELETRISEVVSDVFEKFFKMMYNKRGFWKNDIKR